jgi:hypothetical protein
MRSCLYNHTRDTGGAADPVIYILCVVASHHDSVDSPPLPLGPQCLTRFLYHKALIFNCWTVDHPYPATGDRRRS